MRRVTAISTLAGLFFSLLLVLGWITNEKPLYNQLTHFRREMENYETQCFMTDTREKIEHKTCPLGFVSFRHRRCSKCPDGEFALRHWTSCVKYLTCDNLLVDVRPTELLWTTERWRYFLSEWNSFRLIYSQKISEDVPDSDSSVWETATQLAPHKNFLYPVGYCPNTNTLIYSATEDIYPLIKLQTLLHRRGCDTWIVRMRLVLDYVRLLNYLHLHPSGPYTLCNSHSLDTLLSQFAISNHFKLILANFDNLPGGDKPVICSQKELKGDFVAPEQTWHYSQYKMFNPDEQLRYSHTSDVWKVPDMTKWLLGDSKESHNILNYMATIHHRCKSVNPTLRPLTGDIVKEYESIWIALVGEPDPNTSSL